MGSEMIKAVDVSQEVLNEFKNKDHQLMPANVKLQNQKREEEVPK